MKRIFSLVLMLGIIFSAATPAYAALPETVSPNYVNTEYARVLFTVDDDGMATICADCTARSTTTGIDVTVYLERRIAGGWIWVNIDTGTNTWEFSTSNDFIFADIYYQILTYGEYRVTAIFTVYGTAGDDVITLRQTATHPN